ncbi:T9SS type A sorting domain-containing protein [candidate division KSB1 bacterium]|nr:T9SS type A sorting domain-containing protein [candidate division KSB1 bacterium]RQW09789.1 MAG: T9SS C-terminal target domain-containing protein [candidate division KSB1 bacterium]
MKQYRSCLLILLMVARSSGQDNEAHLVITTTSASDAISIAEIDKLIFLQHQTGALGIEWKNGSMQETDLTAIEKITFEEQSYIEVKNSQSGLITFDLQQNYPNPFNPATTIEFYLDAPQWTKITILNIQGQFVRQLLHEFAAPGRHRVIWDGRDDAGHRVSSGVYFYRATAGESIQMKKCLFIE